MVLSAGFSDADLDDRRAIAGCHLPGAWACCTPYEWTSAATKPALQPRGPQPRRPSRSGQALSDTTGRRHCQGPPVQISLPTRTRSLGRWMTGSGVSTQAARTGYRAAACHDQHDQSVLHERERRACPAGPARDRGRTQVWPVRATYSRAQPSSSPYCGNSAC